MTPIKDVVDPWGASTTAAATIDDAFGASPFTTDAFAESAATTTASSALTSGDAVSKTGESDFFANDFDDNFSK